ncbi:MAG: SPFH domain-containing protein [Polyangiales bacterium]
MNPLVALLALLAVAFVAFMVIVFVIRNLLYVCQPNEVLVFSGTTRQSSVGEVGYRIIKGGRAIRKPIIETVDRIDLTNMIIEVAVTNAYSKGGIPLSVNGVANIKIPGELPLLHNALERFLGRSRQEIMQIARETLEGNLRGVLATLTPEQVNQDKEAFASKLTEEAEHDLNRIGLVLDTLKIQNVSDEVGYLDAIGRMRSAHIRRDAAIAEAQAQAQAAEVKWTSQMRGEVSKIETAIEIARKENERRIADARTRRQAVIAEQLAAVQADVATAQAEVQMQDARIAQVQLRLQADIIQPAMAQRSEAVAAAQANAVTTIEQGKATAKVLTDLARTYSGSAGSGRDVLLMQKLLPVLQQVSGTIGQIKVDRLTVIGQDGNTSNGGSSLAGQLVAANEQVKAAVGVDLGEALRTKLGQPSTPRPSTPTPRHIPAAPPPRTPTDRPRSNTPPQNFGEVTRRTPG